MHLPSNSVSIKPTSVYCTGYVYDNGYTVRSLKEYLGTLARLHVTHTRGECPKASLLAPRLLPKFIIVKGAIQAQDSRKEILTQRECTPLEHLSTSLGVDQLTITSNSDTINHPTITWSQAHSSTASIEGSDALVIFVSKAQAWSALENIWKALSYQIKDLKCTHARIHRGASLDAH